jgi:hypothetical protein
MYLKLSFILIMNNCQRQVGMALGVMHFERVQTGADITRLLWSSFVREYCDGERLGCGLGKKTVGNNSMGNTIAS